MLKDCISDTDGLFDSEFRSCMMHYSFINNRKCAIDDKYLNVQTPFGGLVESRFDGYNYSKYFNLLNDKIVKFSDVLENILPFDLNGLRE